MIKNRSSSLAIIVFVYFLAAFCGFFTFNYLKDIHSFSYQISLLLADVAATVIVFIFSLIFGNASVYDPYWSVQPPVILGLALAKVDSENPLMGCLLFAAVLFWALRLTANWIYNFESFEYQDWRYVMLKEKTGRAYPLINLLGIHMFPTFVVYLCVLPAVTAIAEETAFKPLCLVFIALSIASAIFQGIADIQMHRFRASGAGGFIRTGLWKHSRHPNYACEILMWWGIGLASVFALGWDCWYLLAGALVNTLMFLIISIPMADKRQSRKAGFEEYKKATRMLF
jgi:steroid 5-alpha reductase family enzyme